MDHPCETCLRWPECNGVDADNCPLCVAYAERKLRPQTIEITLPLPDVRMLEKAVKDINRLAERRARRAFYTP